jgi:urease accessory protein
MADLTLAARNGRTRLSRCLTRPPLVVQRALYPDEALAEMAFVYLANPTGGLFQGDRIGVSIHVSPGAKAHVTTQSATKVYSMPGGCAHQEVSLSVDAGGCLEYLPDPVIPFRGAHLVQRTSITVQPGGTLLYWEIIAPGRVAMGESFAYRCLDNQLTVWDAPGHPAYREAYSLTPDSRSPLSLAVLCSDTRPQTLGSMLVLAAGPETGPLLEELSGAARHWHEVKAGVSQLPGGAGLATKVIGPDTASVQAALTCCWSVARKRLLGQEAPSLRKY